MWAVVCCAGIGVFLDLVCELGCGLCRRRAHKNEQKDAAEFARAESTHADLAFEAPKAEPAKPPPDLRYLPTVAPTAQAARFLEDDPDDSGRAKYLKDLQVC